MNEGGFSYARGKKGGFGGEKEKRNGEEKQSNHFDHAIKTKKSIFEDYIITLWLQQEILDDLEWDTVKTMAIETTSHGIPKKRKFGLVGFTGRSDESYKTVDNPQEYLVNKNTS